MPNLTAMEIYLTGFFRWARAFILRDKVHVTGHCLMCGKCCQDILISDSGNWIRNRRQFKALIEKEPGYDRFYISGSSHTGHLTFTCSLQGEDGLCTDHENRLSLCRGYPNVPLYFQGGDLGAFCGFRFKATRFRDLFAKKRELPPADAFSKALKQAMKRSDTGNKQ